MKIVKATRKNIKEIAEILFEEFKKPPFNEKVSFNAVLKSLDFYFKIGNVYTAINESEIAGILKQRRDYAFISNCWELISYSNKSKLSVLNL